MNTKCKICRRKTDSDNMLLCDSCDNGHHIYCLKPKLKSIPSGDWFCPECKPKERVRSPKKKVRKSFSYKEDDATEDDEDQDETPKRKGKSRKKIIESDDEPEEEEPMPKKRGKGKKKVIESEEEEEEEELPKKRGGKKNAEASKKGKKKGGLANLLGKRGAAKKAEKQMKGLDDTHEEDDDDDEDEEVGRRGRKGRKSQEENKENARSKSGKRARNLDDSFDLNVVALEDMVKGLIKHRDGWPFDRPITKADAPDYHLCVRHPMDLDTIRHRLNDMFYTSNQAVFNDIRLVFSNCLSYNMEDAEEYGCAERLEKFFDSQLKAQGLVDEEVSKPRSKKRRL